MDESTGISGKPRRRAAAAARDAGTARRLLEAALRLFGDRGADGVSTRELADAAGVNLAAIPYHFGGKEGLYLAVARYLLDVHAAPVRRLVGELRETVARHPPAPPAAARMLRELIARLGAFMLLDPEAESVVGYIAREQLRPTAAFEVLYEGLIRHAHETLTRLVSAIEGRAADDRRSVIRAHAIVGQILAFDVARTTALRRLGWDRYTPVRVNEVLEELADFACRGLGAGGTRSTKSGAARTGRRRRKA